MVTWASKARDNNINLLAQLGLNIELSLDLSNG